jgi:hypothetical protein
MKRRDLFRNMALAGLAAPLALRESAGHVVAHNWDRYDFGSGPAVKGRLNRDRFRSTLPKIYIPAAM